MEKKPIEPPKFKGKGEHSVLQLEKICEQFEEYFHQQKTTGSWVSVSERLPEINQHVLVLRTNPNIVTTGYIHKYGHWIWSNLNGSTHKADNTYKITHWMPMPEAPAMKVAKQTKEN